MVDKNVAIEAEKKFKTSVQIAQDYVENFDILETINNVGNDEIFTPLKICNLMLDVFPNDIWINPNYKWLNPVDKNGVFIREIAIRLDKGLTAWESNAEKRRKHILKNMLFSIGLTRFTAQVSRRTVYYCSKANKAFDGKVDENNTAVNGYAVGNGSWFDDEEGNIITPTSEHSFIKGRCQFCGVSQSSKYTDPKQIEHYAYQFIHDNDIQKYLERRFKKGEKEMKFDIIIGNPPYQLSFGIDGGNSSNSQSIYNLFIDQAIRLNPRYLCMITPSRWMTKTAQGISEEWVDKMLSDKRIQIVHDYQEAKDCFPNVNIMGGVSYFLWNREYNGKCKYNYHYSGNKQIDERFDYLNTLNSGIVIRDPKYISIIEKIEKKFKGYFLNSQNNFSGLVSPKHYFDDGKILTSNWKGYVLERDANHNIKYYVTPSSNEFSFAWVSIDHIPKNKETIKLHKVYIPAAHGGEKTVIGEPFYGEPNSICSQTYLVIGYDGVNHKFSKTKCMNIVDYLKTKFVRFLISAKKKTQNGPRGVYQFVPLVDFNKKWNDDALFSLFNLSKEEIKFIEESIKEKD